MNSLQRKSLSPPRILKRNKQSHQIRHRNPKDLQVNQNYLHTPSSDGIHNGKEYPAHRYPLHTNYTRTITNGMTTATKNDKLRFNHKMN